MKTVNISCDELYPVYEINKPYPTAKIIDVSDEFYAKYKKLMEENEDMQDELEILYYQQMVNNNRHKDRNCENQE